MTEQGIGSTIPIAHRYEHDCERDWLALERILELSSQSAVEVDADALMWMAPPSSPMAESFTPTSTSTRAGTSTSMLEVTPTCMSPR